MKNLQVSNFSVSKIDRRAIHKIVNAILKKLNLRLASLEINFLDENLMRDINKKYLNHDYNTDIITFTYSKEKVILEGEIFISVDDARANARRYKVLLENEILRLIVHGILHMIGYDDVEAAERKIMKQKENALVRELWNDSLKGIITNDG